MDRKEDLRRFVKNSKVLWAIWEFIIYWTQPVIDLRKMFVSIAGYFWFLRDIKKMQKFEWC
ncbi:MAG: hypothetical protein JEZ06_01315 [Anaerolineaceae bacterium]|nr:hypothetical protein [Anaerolineaceae bacterium]